MKQTKIKKTTKTNKPKAIVLLSGGLDSRLVCKVLQEQDNLEVEAVYFILPFTKDNTKEIEEFCLKNKIKLHIIDCTKEKLFSEYMKMLKHPKHGRGVCLNPCIDCHGFIFKKAKELAEKEKIEIIATGEVLDERPMSQYKRALSVVEEESGLNGRLLRPLSAKLLEETEAEKKGLIDRSKLLDIHGRSRQKQLELAEKYGLNFPTPGGGCLLCEKGYCEKLKPLLKGNISYKDIELLRVGRHFLASKIILGRNQKENDFLEKEKGIKVMPKEPGATALVKDEKLVEMAKELIQKYSRNKINGFDVAK